MATSMQFGDLLFRFTDLFRPAWTDHGSHNKKYDGSFWTPAPQDGGFRPLGGIGFGGTDHKYPSPDGTHWALCVADATPPGSGRNPAVVAPHDYELVWIDKGSGARTDGACWRPVPLDREKYVACGDIFVKGHNNKPGTEAVWCVRKDLVEAGKAGEMIWSIEITIAPAIHDVPPRPKMREAFSAWQINAPGPLMESDPVLGLFAANTFVGRRSLTRPADNEVYVLKVPIPAQAIKTQPPKPVMESSDRPITTTQAVVDHVVTVPFTAIKDDRMTLAEQVSNSPFYTIKRSAYYTMELYEDNDLPRDQSATYSVTTGITKSASETFSSETAITTGYEAGIEIAKGIFNFSGKASASVAKTLGFAHSTEVGEMESKTVGGQLIVAPHSTGTLWVLTYALQLFRANDTPAGKPLIFKIHGTFVTRGYPPFVAAPRLVSTQ